MYAIYTLIDPVDNTVRYVGITKDVYARFIQHITCQGTNVQKNLWISEHRAHCRLIHMATIELTPTKEKALELERKWISYYRKMGMPLLNQRIPPDIPASRPIEKKIQESTHPFAAQLRSFLAFARAQRAKGKSTKEILIECGILEEPTDAIGE